jgi:hypothetical protein
MLAGLLFAIEEAADPAGRLVALLPFAGTTLIEHQARQLMAAGAAQIIVIADPVPPELAGALHRMGRRGAAIDPVRDVAEAAVKLHPLSRVVMLADGLVAADAAVAALAGEGKDALLVVPGADAPSGFERIGGASAWAGIARLEPARIAEVAALPPDYDPQSTLLRVAEAAGAARVVLPAPALAAGHGVEREAVAMEGRGRRIVAAAVVTRYGWFDRYLAAPLARAAMPVLTGTGVSGAAVSVAVGVLMLLGVVALMTGWPRAGMVLALLATSGCVLAATLAALREEEPVATATKAATAGFPYAALLLLGRWASTQRGDMVPLLLAGILVVAAVLGQRAICRYRGWWGSPPAYALVAAVATLPGWAGAGLALAAAYATLTLAAAIEALRVESRRSV